MKYTTNVHLNFLQNTEEAFNFYKSILGGEFTTLQRFQDMPNNPGATQMSAEDSKGILYISLPIGNMTLSGTDALASFGHSKEAGNIMSLSIDTETREEADRLFSAFSEGGNPEMPMADMFWWSYYGMCTDKYGIQWIFNCAVK